MPDEIELKFLDIDKEAMIAKLEALGATKAYDEDLLTVTFEGHGCSRKDSSGKYLRVRKIGDDVFLTYKSPLKDETIAVRDEHEVTVSDMETTVRILERLGFSQGAVGKKNRLHYTLDDVHVEIDTYSFIPPFLEIEAPSKESLIAAAKKLGLDQNKGKNLMITELYPEKFKDMSV